MGLRISSQIAKVLHQDKRLIELGPRKRVVFCNLANDARATQVIQFPTLLTESQQLRTLCGKIYLRVTRNRSQESVDELFASHRRRILSLKFAALDERLGKCLIVRLQVCACGHLSAACAEFDEGGLAAQC